MYVELSNESGKEFMTEFPKWMIDEMVAFITIGSKTTSKDKLIFFFLYDENGFFLLVSENIAKVMWKFEAFS